MKPETAPGKIQRIDNVVLRVTKAFSYVGVLAIVVMGFLAVADILTAKIFYYTIPNQYEYIPYALLLVVYTFIPAIIVRNGLMSVDILTRKFSRGVVLAINVIAYIVGTILFSYIGYLGFTLFLKHYHSKTLSAMISYAFQIWPFTLIYAIGLVLICLTCLWRVIRMIATFKNPPPEEDPIAEEVEAIEEATGTKDNPPQAEDTAGKEAEE